jgi:hypothetical protein
VLRAGALTAVCCLAVCACGSTHVSEAGFRAKANTICRKLNQQANATTAPTTAAALRNALVRVESGIDALARLKPPRRDEARYADFLMRLRKLFAFARTKGPELVALTSQIEKAMPQGLGVTPTRRQQHQFALLSQKLKALEQPIRNDVRLVDADARALQLPACASGAAGS